MYPHPKYSLVLRCAPTHNVLLKKLYTPTQNVPLILRRKTVHPPHKCLQKVYAMVVCRICMICSHWKLPYTDYIAWKTHPVCTMIESTIVHIDTHPHMKPLFTLWALGHFTPSLLRHTTGAVYRNSGGRFDFLLHSTRLSDWECICLPCFKTFYQVEPQIISWSKTRLPDSSPLASAVADARANKPQSTLPVCITISMYLSWKKG